MTFYRENERLIHIKLVDSNLCTFGVKYLFSGCSEVNSIYEVISKDQSKNVKFYNIRVNPKFVKNSAISILQQYIARCL